MLELTATVGPTEHVLRFEHSLRSVAAWESKYKRIFMSKTNTDPEEMLDYFRFMLLDPESDPDLIYALSPEALDRLANYINESRTASWLPEPGKQSGPRDAMSSELMYYWLVELRIPFEVQDWHLSRFLMLVRIIQAKRNPEKNKRPASETMTDWRAENDRRLAKLNTTG